MKTYTQNRSSLAKEKSFFKQTLFFILLSGLMSLTGFAQVNYTFTACGATGQFGPTQSQVNTAYASTSLNGSVTATSGIQTFTIPYTGNYRIEAYGAQGGSSSFTGGLGAKMAGDFTFTAGTVLKILVGQAGINGILVFNGDAQQSGATGGGGSFVSTLTNSALVVAGGGGGSSQVGTAGGVNATGAGGTVSVNGLDGGGASGSGGTSGNGGLTYNWSGWHGGTGGGGFTGNGVNSSAGNTTYGTANGPGISFVNGGAGGTGGSSGRHGGFGGGGSSGFTGAGGGGYSGGGAGTLTGGIGGGGGGSFNGGTNQSNTSATNSGDGKVVIIPLCTITLSVTTSTGSVASICSGSSLTLTTNAASNYTWSTGNTTTTSIVVSPTSNQTYSIVGTSTANCVASAAIAVTVSPGLPSLSISNPSNNICLGKSATLTASGAFTYTWSPAITNGLPFAPSTTATYTVTGQNGCGTSTAVTTVTVAPLAVSASVNPTIVCAGTTCTLSATAAVNGFTWLPMGTPGQSLVTSPSVNSIYTVAASDGTCSGTATVAVTTKASPTITAITSSSVGCSSDVFTLTANGGVSYSWSPGNLTGTSVTVSPANPTSYQVVGTNSLGCTGLAGLIILTNPSPTVVITTNKPLVCVGAPSTLYASGALNYNWSGGPSSQTYTVNPTVASTYTVTGINSFGCIDTETITISVFNPSVSVSASTPSICFGGTTTLNASGASTFLWSNGAGTGSSVVVSPSVNTTYTVSATSASNAVTCSSSGSISITVFNNPTISIVATKTVMCRKDSPAVLTGSGAVTYFWSNSAATNTINASSAVATTSVYSVTGTDANGCINTASVQILVKTCTGINEEMDPARKLAIYPNPNNGQFTISGGTDLELNLLNEIGQMIRTFKLTAINDYKVEINDLANGIYFIVSAEDPASINQKIIVNK